MTILITGGAGFIGGHLAERFVNDGHDVVVLDNLTTFYDRDIKHQNIETARSVATESDGQYKFIEGDIRDHALVTDLVEDAEYVYHQAGQAGVRSSVDSPREYNEVNVDGTLNLLDACRDESIERFVMASSSSVYGVPQYLPYDEQHPTTPVSPYGASKLAAERYACSYSQVYDFPAVAIRYFTVYGPRMRPNMAISNFVSRCANRKPPIIYGDGTQTRDFTYIDDIVEANVKLLTEDGADGEAINIGSTDNIEIRTLARLVRDEFDLDIDLTYDDRHDADAEHTHADTIKAEKLIGYEPTYTIREGVQAFISWYRENREWYEPLVLKS